MNEVSNDSESMSPRELFRMGMLHIGIGLERWAGQETSVTHGQVRKILAAEAAVGAGLIAVFGPQLNMTLEQFNQMIHSNGKSMSFMSPDVKGSDLMHGLVSQSIPNLIENTVNDILSFRGSDLDAGGLKLLLKVGALATKAEHTKLFGELTEAFIAVGALVSLGVGHIEKTNDQKVVRSTTLQFLGNAIQRMSEPNAGTT